MLYEKYFNSYIGLIALKYGENYIDKYLLKVERDYIFMILKENANNLFLKYEISEKEKKVNIYLIDKYGYQLDKIEVVLFYNAKKS